MPSFVGAQIGLMTTEARHETLRVDAAAEWRRPLTGAVLGLLAFESLTGLTVYLLPFSRFNQFAVLLHTAIGVLMLAPVAWYVGQHWYRRFRGNLSHYQLLGYLAAAALLMVFFSGLVLSLQALWGTRITPFWDLLHIIAGLALIGLLTVHLLVLVVRPVHFLGTRKALSAARWACARQTLAWGAVPTAACALFAWRHTTPSLDDAFPAEYSFKYGADRPYAPSLARKDSSKIESAMKASLGGILDAPQRDSLFANLHPDPTKHEGLVSVAERACAQMTLSVDQRKRINEVLESARSAFASSGAIHPRQLAGSEGCGRCHPQIVEEWLPSAHRYASMDFVFQKVQQNMAQELVPEATRYCAGCHDPIALFSGAKNVGNETLSVEGSNEGVSCLVCHSTVQTDVRGNADYTIAPQPRYLFEFSEGWLAQTVSDFLIRAYPQFHVTSYSRPLYKTAESCGACHKQFVDAELNDFGWVQGQNQYDSWRKSRWHKEGDPAGTLACRDCHMPLVTSKDPAAGDRDDANRSPSDGKHRSHRFLAANQFVPSFHKLPGAEEHCALTEKWLRGDYEVPEIADRWTRGPVVKLSLVAPDEVRQGETVEIQTIVTNNKAGHDFPTGPMDMIEGWVEVEVTDAQGHVVFASASPDDRGYLTNPQIVFKAELINRLGELIGRHELWHLVGARFKRVLFPGMTDTTTFAFGCPGVPRDGAAPPAGRLGNHTFEVPPQAGPGELRVSAVVWYCKYSAPFLDRLFGAEAGLRSEVTDVARAQATITVMDDPHAALESTP